MLATFDTRFWKAWDLNQYLNFNSVVNPIFSAATTMRWPASEPRLANGFLKNGDIRSCGGGGARRRVRRVIQAEATATGGASISGPESTCSTRLWKQDQHQHSLYITETNCTRYIHSLFQYIDCDVLFDRGFVWERLRVSAVIRTWVHVLYSGC